MRFKNLINVAPGDYYARLHAEEMTLHGDPALKLNGESLPDYTVEPSGVVISPSFISIADNTFIVNAHFANLGKAVPDSITILIKRQYPDGSSTTILLTKENSWHQVKEDLPCKYQCRLLQQEIRGRIILR